MQPPWTRTSTPADGRALCARKSKFHWRNRKTGYFSPYLIAELYADLGDKEHAFEWLNTAYQEHGHLLYGLRTDFAFDSLRSDPRFQDLLRRMNLQP